MTGPDGEKLCANCGEPNPVRAKFCLECGTKVADDELGERRVLTVLFADLSGFTAFSEGSDVEEVHALAQEAADRLSEIVDRYGGTVDKIIGDAVMAVWGAPVTHEDDAERAVRAALDMQTVVANRSEKFFGMALSTGLYTGEAIWAPIGPDGRYTALGDTVNTAARLQGAAGKGEILVGADTYRATSDVIDYVDVEPVKAKNKAEPVPAWRAVAVKGARKAVRELPLVGRQAELARLWELWELVRAERVPYLAVLSGAPGIGKSRLVRALESRLEETAQVLTGRCLDYGEGITYWPVIEMVKGAAGILGDDDAETSSRKLGALLEALGSEDLDELRTMAVAMANLIAAPTTPRGTYTATDVTQGELHWGIRRVFQLLATKRPLVLVFEDLHWADPSLLDLVGSFVDISSDAPLFVLGSGRPELDASALTGKRNTRHVEVGVLTEEECHALVAHMLGTDTVDDQRLVELLERAAGNPLFLEETIRMLVDVHALDDEGRIIPERVEALTIPTGLRALIGTRLDRMSGLEKRTAGRASVVGEVFWSGAVAFLEGPVEGADPALDELEIERALGDLETRDVVSAREASTITGQREWAFRHGLIRDVVYDRIPKRQRVRLHARCGEWLAELPGYGDELIEIIAHHLEQSCLLAKGVRKVDFAPPVIEAVRALTRAGRKAETRQSTREALSFYTRALALLEGAFPETSIELRVQRAHTLGSLGDWDVAYDELIDIVADAENMGRVDLQCKSLLRVAEMDILRGRLSEGQSHLAQAEKLAGKLDDPKIRIRYIWHRAILHERQGSARAVAEEDLRAAIALAEEIEDSDDLLEGHTRLGVFLYNLGNLGGAERELEKARKLAQEQGSLRELSLITFYLGALRLHRGPHETAATDLANAVEWLERTGDTITRIFALQWNAKLALARNDLRAAVRFLRIGYALAKESSGPVLVPIARTLAEAFARQNRVSEAREIAASAREAALAEDIEAQVHVAVADAYVALAEKDEQAARQHFSVAMAMVEKMGQPAELGETLLAEADILAAFGDTAGAADRLERARAIFAEASGDATVDSISEALDALQPDAVVRELRPTGSV